MKVYFDRPGAGVIEGNMYDKTPVNNVTTLVIKMIANSYKDRGIKINKDGVFETTTSFRILDETAYFTYSNL